MSRASKHLQCACGPVQGGSHCCCIEQCHGCPSPLLSAYSCISLLPSHLAIMCGLALQGYEAYPNALPLINILQKRDIKGILDGAIYDGGPNIWWNIYICMPRQGDSVLDLGVPAAMHAAC